MNKKRLLILFSIVGVWLIVSFCMIRLSIKNSYDYKNNTRMFETVDDLAFIDEYVVEENIRLDDVILDTFEEYLLENKTVTIEYNGIKINIFAYTFESTECCIEYANKVSGNNYKPFYSGDDISEYYHELDSNLISQREKLLVFSNEKAYVISVKMTVKELSEFREFIEFFMNQLPIEVKIKY